MIRENVIAILARHRGGVPAISGPGTISRLLYTVRHERASIYQMDMGYATAMALGVALARPEQKVLAVEGDGSIIAAMGVLSTIARYRPSNLVAVVIDNGVYASAGDGSVQTASACGTDIAAVARACGVPADHAFTVETEGDADSAIERAFAQPGPWVIVVRVSDSDRQQLQGARSRGVIPFDLVETALNFRHALADQQPPAGG